jgi:uncharacterized RDD family membrane protein YckC
MPQYPQQAHQPYPPGMVPPGAPGMYGKATGPRAGFWQRVGAAILDGLIVGVPAWIVTAILFGLKIATKRIDGTVHVDAGKLFAEVLIGSVVVLLYRALLDGGPRGQTIGKRVVGIRVVDASTGTVIGYPRGFGRAGAKLLFDLLMYACLIGLLDYLWMLWDAENQTLHDKMVNTYVVPVEAYPIQ